MQKQKDLVKNPLLIKWNQVHYYIYKDTQVLNGKPYLIVELR